MGAELLLTEMQVLPCRCLLQFAAAADRWMGFLTLLDESLRLLCLGWVFRVLLQLGALGQMFGLRLRV